MERKTKLILAKNYNFFLFFFKQYEVNKNIYVRKKQIKHFKLQIK